MSKPSDRAVQSTIADLVMHDLLADMIVIAWTQGRDEGCRRDAFATPPPDATPFPATECKTAASLVA